MIDWIEYIAENQLSVLWGKWIVQVLKKGDISGYAYFDTPPINGDKAIVYPTKEEAFRAALHMVIEESHE